MKISEVTIADIVAYLKLDDDTDVLLGPIKTASIQYISSHTGIPITSSDSTVKTLDDFEDFYIVLMVLCQDMYDNRSLYVDTSNLNRVVSSILDMHRTNLLPTPDEV